MFLILGKIEVIFNLFLVNWFDLFLLIGIMLLESLFSKVWIFCFVLVFGMNLILSLEVRLFSCILMSWVSLDVIFRCIIRIFFGFSWVISWFRKWVLLWREVEVICRFFSLFLVWFIFVLYDFLIFCWSLFLYLLIIRWRFFVCVWVFISNCFLVWFRFLEYFFRNL